MLEGASATDTRHSQGLASSRRKIWRVSHSAPLHFGLQSVGCRGIAIHRLAVQVGPMLEAEGMLRARALYSAQPRDYRALIGAWMLQMEAYRLLRPLPNSADSRVEPLPWGKGGDDAALRQKLCLCEDQ